MLVLFLIVSAPTRPLFIFCAVIVKVFKNNFKNFSCKIKSRYASIYILLLYSYPAKGLAPILGMTPIITAKMLHVHTEFTEKSSYIQMTGNKVDDSGSTNDSVPSLYSSK